MLTIDNIILDNFRNHSHIEVDFAPGMNIIRGANEAGKSSLLHGLAYCLFGTAMLVGSLEETVTWGASKGALHTQAQFTKDGDIFICSRGGSGAELYKGSATGSPLVTGQREVTEAVLKIMTLASTQAASRIMFAGQNDVRGIIALGATASALFIEELIDLSEVDNLIKQVTEETQHRPQDTARLVDELKQAEDSLSEISPPSDEQVHELELALITLEQQLAEARKVEEQATDQAAKAKQASATVKRIRDQLLNLQKKHKQTEQQRDKALATAGGLQAAQQAVQTAEQAIANSQLYTFYTDEYLPRKEAREKLLNVWEGSFDSLAAQLQEWKASREDAVDARHDDKIQYTKLQAQVVEKTHCPTCKQPIVDLEGTAARNEKIKANLLQLQKQIDVSTRQVTELDEQIAVAVAIQAEQQQLDVWLANANSFEITVDREQIPNDFRMERVEKPLTLVTQADVILAKQQVTDALLASERLATIDETLREQADEEARLLVEVDKAMEQKLAYSDTEATLASAHTVAADIAEKKSEVSSQLAVLNDRIDAAGRAKEVLRKKIGSIRVNIAEVSKNAALVKALREARLTVSDNLWRELLTVAERYFSLFRGRSSTLAIGKKGILVDGQASAPSGSTLDMLGLALRVAILRVFTGVSLCILDEPSSGCDDVRTASMTGGLLGSDLDQIIMVTHKDVDEASGHLIELS